MRRRKPWIRFAGNTATSSEIWKRQNEPFADNTAALQKRIICRKIYLHIVKYLFGIILAAYKDFDDRFALVETKLSALETVRRTAMNKVSRFTKQDIRELCPSLSASSIEGALRKLVNAGELKREGSGKNTCYYRTN